MTKFVHYSGVGDNWCFGGASCLHIYFCPEGGKVDSNALIPVLLLWCGSETLLKNNRNVFNAYARETKFLRSFNDMCHA
jgi:hypothetical protein